MLSANMRRVSAIQSSVIGASIRNTYLRSFSTTLPVSPDGFAEGELSPQQFRDLHQIKVTASGFCDYDPMPDFASTPFLPELKKVLQREGYTSPTAIQSQSWPIILDDRDVISVARTGSGKTIGFLLPAFQKLLLDKKNPSPTQDTGRGSRRGSPPSVLVLAPTRELTVQIETEAAKYCSAGVRSVCLYGGSPKGPQINALRQGVDVAICTPGRCNDLNIMGVLDLSKVKYLVLDEADRMLDMGFEPQIREIVDQLPEKRQTIFFTATWPKEVQQMARTFLTNPVQINVGDNDTLNANKAINQNIIITNPRDKLKSMMSLLQDMRGEKTAKQCPKTIVFVARKADADFVSDTLYDEGYTTEALHGDKSQQARDRSMEKFRSGAIRILVATDVAARGLDVKDITTVVNYDFPSNVEDYVHRIGRTARGEATGTAHTFLTSLELKNANHMTELVGVMQRCGQTIPREVLEAARGGSGQRGSSMKYGSPTQRGQARGSGYGSSSGGSDYGRGGGGGGRGGSSYGSGGGRGGSSYSKYNDEDDYDTSDRRAPSRGSKGGGYASKWMDDRDY